MFHHSKKKVVAGKNLPRGHFTELWFLCLLCVLQVWTAPTTWLCTRAWEPASLQSPSSWWPSCCTGRTTASTVWMSSIPPRSPGVSSLSTSRPPDKVREREWHQLCADTSRQPQGQKASSSKTSMTGPPCWLMAFVCIKQRAVQVPLSASDLYLHNQWKDLSFYFDRPAPLLLWSRR